MPVFWWSAPRLISSVPRVSQVFLREAERQRLQALLHQEVLRRIVTLQRRFRAVLERKRFVDVRRATFVIQVRQFHNFTLLTDT